MGFKTAEKFRGFIIGKRKYLDLIILKRNYLKQKYVRKKITFTLYVFNNYMLINVHSSGGPLPGMPTPDFVHYSTGDHRQFHIWISNQNH